MVEEVVTKPVADMEATMSNTSIIEQIKEAPEKIAKKFELNKEKVLELSFYLIGGFLAGFLLKRFSKVVVTIILVVLALISLEYFKLIDLTVHWDKVRQFIGMSPLPTVDGTIFSYLWVWIKDHLLQVVCLTIGFLAGIKLG